METRGAPIDLYFDFISPFAYLAWKRLPVLAEARGREVRPIPVLFAALLNHYGHLGPAEIAPKRAYIFKQVLRRGHERGLTITPPPAHPFKPLLGLRIAGDPSLDAGARARVIDALFDATWGDGPGITDPDTVAGLLDRAGVDGAALVAAAGAPAAKDRLRRATEDALAAGVFGVPTMIADGELFWGDDSLDDLDRFLRGEDPVDAAALARWEGLPAAADRRGKR
ncbi:MAG: 2-hydroxychromene-2-carboxylate isomerase [Myxococcales bacterium]|nr:2-hydroxychromene-2-carboxylate isomerase [Myxococcales bacterium]